MICISLRTNLVDWKKYALQGSMRYLGYELRGSRLYEGRLRDEQEYKKCAFITALKWMRSNHVRFEGRQPEARTNIKWFIWICVWIIFPICVKCFPGLQAEIACSKTWLEQVPTHPVVEWIIFVAVRCLNRHSPRFQRELWCVAMISIQEKNFKTGTSRLTKYQWESTKNTMDLAPLTGIIGLEPTVSASCDHWENESNTRWLRNNRGLAFLTAEHRDRYQVIGSSSASIFFMRVN